MLDYLDIWKLLAGLGLVLFGIRHLESALKQLTGKRFRRFLRYSTGHPFGAIFSGIAATTLVQSSSLVSLIVLAFVGAGIIPLANAIGIVLGSNLGTTFTGWVVATIGFKLDLTTFIYPLIGIGSLSYGVLKGPWRLASQLLFAVALLLLGLEWMKDSTAALTTHADVNRLAGYPLIVFLLVGALFTAVIQSSSATMILILSALYSGIISVPAAASLVIGADLGTTSTVLLGSLQGPIAKRQLAMAHVLFNLLIDTIAFICLAPLLSLIALLGIEDPLFVLVAFHSLFNLFGLALFSPFIQHYARLLQQWFKEDVHQLERYIHNVPADVTDAALQALTKESKNFLSHVIYLNSQFLRIESETCTPFSEEFKLPDEVLTKDKKEHYIALKEMEGKLVHYALNIQSSLSESSRYPDQYHSISNRIDALIHSVRYGVYSVKSLKDIDPDLDVLPMQDSEALIDYYAPLQHEATSLYNKCLLLISEPCDSEAVVEEILELKEKSKQFHRQFAQEIYKKMSQIHLSSLDLSTLLNINREMQASERALLNALRLL